MWAHRGAAVVVVMYPEVRAVLPELDDDVPESYRSTTSRTCWSPSSPAMTPNVTHHMDEEEQDWFPKVRAGLGRKELQHPGRG